ncbi:gamma-glutamyltransferase [Ornithinicoccus halotolerans]|uniref:gamma-glutamyltransferase n=1 Tax=Ornithinicoccus halotolerans TaxID=1748220 RepID=UPI001297ED5A|nr:gamma-glutamyltransferase [Ornithinicoccus halotolerans]
MTTRAAVAAPNPLCAQAGAAALAAGGSAVDAAAAALLTASVTEPGIMAPLGGCFVSVWPAAGSPVVIDGNVEMPGREAAPERWGQGLVTCRTSYGGGLTTLAGPGSVATPGMVAALGEAHERYGRAPWAELLGTAVTAAREGFPLGRSAASYLALVRDSVLAWDPATRAVYTDAGAALPAGHLVRDEALAQSLEQLAAEGPQSLYTGELGRRLARDVQERGGLLGPADLAAYRPLVRAPLRTRLAGWELAANPPPSIGGPVLTAMLRLVEHAPDRSARTLAEVMRRVLDLRLQRLDTAEDLEAAGHELISTLRELGTVGLPRSADTVHVSVVDAEGTACAATASAGYGSGMTVSGTGLLANNALGEPELNRRGTHVLPPGTRLPSNMAPATGRHADGSVLAIGSPGADRITTALLQVLTRFCLDGEELQHAVDAPRLHVRHLAVPGDDGEVTVRLDHEDDPALTEALAGHELPTFVHEPHAMYFGGVGAALRAADGALHAAADPRRASATMVG